VIEGRNMLPEAALPKLCWALGHTRDVEEVRKIMTTDIAGEITNRELYSGFSILQGGLDSVYPSIEKVDRVDDGDIH
jgi:hypothetical protein